MNVAVGIIIKRDSMDGDKYFVCRRAAHQHQGNKWEFPGGKVDTGETPREALKRELKEEVGIDVQGDPVLEFEINHKYPDKHVNLYIFTVDAFKGEATGNEGQEAKWVNLPTLSSLDFPEANAAIISHLQSK